MRVSMGKRPQNMAMMEPGGNQQRACPSSKTLKLWSEKGMVVIVCYSCNWGILKLYSITTKKHGQWELSKHTLCDKTSYTIRFHQDPLLLLQLLNASWRHWLQNDIISYIWIYMAKSESFPNVWWWYPQPCCFLNPKFGFWSPHVFHWNDPGNPGNM